MQKTLGVDPVEYIIWDDTNATAIDHISIESINNSKEGKTII